MEYDLLLIIDATFSMYSYLEALRIALPQRVSISAITGCFSRCGLLAYRNYDQKESALLEWSGWQENGHNEEGDERASPILWHQPGISKNSVELTAQRQRRQQRQHWPRHMK